MIFHDNIMSKMRYPTVVTLTKKIYVYHPNAKNPIITGRGGETKGLDISYNVLITLEYDGVEKIYLVTHWSLIQLYPHVSKSCVKCVREWGQN